MTRLKLLGKNIKKYRKAHNLSQNQLAELVDLSREHLAAVETGKELISETDAEVQKTLKNGCFLTSATSPSSSVKMAEKCDFPPFLTFVRSPTARLKNELFRDLPWAQAAQTF